jgi:hypothetical protein
MLRGMKLGVSAGERAAGLVGFLVAIGIGLVCLDLMTDGGLSGLFPRHSETGTGAPCDEC